MRTPFINKKDRQEKAVGELENHLISDSVVFIYTPTAPQPKVRDANGAKTPKHLFNDAFAPNEKGFLQPRTNLLVQGNYILYLQKVKNIKIFILL